MAIWLPRLDGRPGPKYLQIVEAMAEDIAAGRLPVGTRLPPHRELAYRLGLSPNTTNRAYAEGVRRALLRGEVGRGTYVRAAEAPSDSGAVGDLRRAAQGPIDLSRNLPLPGLAAPHLRRTLDAIARGGGVAALLDYQTDGDLALHAGAARAWLESCGVAAGPEETLVTNGAQHGLLCSLMALLRPGELLLTEALTYAPVLAMAARLGLKTAGVALDRGGLCPDAFARACATAAPKALYLTPTLQAPTTATLSAERRRAIAAIAQRHGVLIIEDDVFGRLPPDRPEAICRHAPDSTVYVTSLSKCVAPGLRVGVLRAPERLGPALRHAVKLSAWMTPPLTLEIAARLILDGTAAQLTEEQRAAAQRRQRLARDLLGAGNYAAAPQGLHIWLPLPEGWTADVFQAAAARQGVLVATARDFATPDRLPAASAAASGPPEAIRICLSHEASEARLATGLKRLAELLHRPAGGAAMAL